MYNFTSKELSEALIAFERRGLKILAREALASSSDDAKGTNEVSIKNSHAREAAHRAGRTMGLITKALIDELNKVADRLETKGMPAEQADLAKQIFGHLDAINERLDAQVADGEPPAGAGEFLETIVSLNDQLDEHLATERPCGVRETAGLVAILIKADELLGEALPQSSKSRRRRS